MVTHFNDSLDDPLVFDGQGLILGQSSFLKPVDVPQDQALILLNVNLETNATITTRRGFHRLDSGEFATFGTIHAVSHIASESWFHSIVVFADGNVYLRGSNGTENVISSAYDHTVEPWQCSLAEIAGRLYFSCGTGSILQLVPSSTHAEDIHTIAAAEDEITLAMSDVGAIIKSVRKIDSWEVTGATSNPGARVDLRALTAHTYRLFAATGVDEIVVSKILPDLVPSGLIFDNTATNGSALFTANDSFRVGIGDSDKIVALQPYKDFRLCVLKDHSIFIVNADPTQSDISNWAIQQVTDKVGCVAEKSAVNVGNDIVFLARDGIRTVSNLFQQEQIGTSSPLSSPIEDIIERINWAHAHKAVATHWKGQYILSVPLDEAIEPNACIVYNVNSGRWLGTWTGPRITGMTISAITGERKKLVCSNILSDGSCNLVEYRDFIDEDSAIDTDYMDRLESDTETAIPFRVVTRGMDFGEGLNPKNVDYLEVEFWRSNAYVNIRIIGDAGEEVVLTNGEVIYSGSGALTLVFNLPALLTERGVIRKRLGVLGRLCARDIQVVVESSTAEQIAAKGIESSSQRFVSLRRIHVGAYVETIEATA